MNTSWSVGAAEIRHSHVNIGPRAFTSGLHRKGTFIVGSARSGHRIAERRGGRFRSQQPGQSDVTPANLMRYAAPMASLSTACI